MSAGEAFALLPLLAIDAERPAVRGLPDRAITAAVRAK